MEAAVMTSVYLIRHGETEYNQRGCYYGWTDCSLTDRGIEQAKALRDVFEHIDYDIILCSDLKRAADTARIISDSKELVLDSRLREMNFGHWEGKSYVAIEKEYQEDWSLWLKDWKNSSPTAGESTMEMYSRICSFVAEILDKYKDKKIVIVGHNGSLRMIAVSLLGLPLEKLWSFSFEQGKYSLFEIVEGHCTIKYINKDSSPISQL
jgi:alpha-ribazole phosphatase